MFLNIFFITTPTSKYLQPKGLNYLSAWNRIMSFKKELRKISSDAIFSKNHQKCKRFYQYCG